MTGYAATLTINSTKVLTLQNFTSTLGGTLAGSGQITLQAAATLQGAATSSSTLTLNSAGAATLNTGTNCVWGNLIGNAGVQTLSGSVKTQDATLANLWSSGGDQRLYITRNLSGSSLSGASGTPIIVMNGTGTFGTSGLNVGIEVEIDTTGTITIGTDVRFGSSNKKFKYITGTVDTSTSGVGVFAAYTFDTSGMTWANMTVTSSDITLLSELKVTNFTCNGTLTISGAYPLTFGSCNIPGGKSLTMVNGTTMTCSALYMSGNDINASTITTGVGNTVYVAYTGAEDGYRIMYATLTRVTFLGRHLWNWYGTNTTVTNCDVVTPASTRLANPVVAVM